MSDEEIDEFLRKVASENQKKDSSDIVEAKKPLKVRNQL